MSEKSDWRPTPGERFMAYSQYVDVAGMGRYSTEGWLTLWAKPGGGAETREGARLSPKQMGELFESGVTTLGMSGLSSPRKF